MPDTHLVRLLDEGTGTIETISIWSVWDCKEGKWSNAPKVTLRNTLLVGLHPGVKKNRFAIGEIAKTDKNPNLLSPFTDPQSKIRYFLDLASNSRTHGRFTFNALPVGMKYCGTLAKDQWKRIIYGSILHTGCKHLVFGTFRYIVVDDERRDVQGNPQDDKTNLRHWNTGDSHGKASREFLELLSQGSEVGVWPADPDIPLQFRIALREKWIAKGTIAYNPELDNSGYDLVIPLSSLKGNKPKEGNYEGKLLCGLVFEAEERRAKPGWMLFQWFSFETLETDRIITKLIAKCERLAASLDSIQNLAALLRVDQKEAEIEMQEGNDGLQSEAEYINVAMSIVMHDLRGKLLLHPYLLGKIKERLAAVWLNLAKAAGVRFYSLMAQPDEYFAKYEFEDKNGNTVFSRKVFCAPGMVEGEYIVFCNPMRHWGDCQLWENVREGTYAKGSGLMAASRKLLLNLGRDTDGDFIQLIRSSQYPALRSAIANFAKPPSVAKLPKVPLTGNLQQIAINSMNDLTGIVATLLGRARAAKMENIPILIPPGGMQVEPREMRIVDFLSQELQIAVDSLKSAYPNNEAGLNAVRDFLNTNNANIPWLSDFKQKDCYLTRPCNVDENAIDTVSRLVKLVNSYWRPAALEDGLDLNSFRNTLFAGAAVTKEQQDFAFSQRDGYGQEMGEAIRWKEQNEGDTTRIRQVTLKYQAQKLEILEGLTGPDGMPYSLRSWAAAYWRASHTVKEDSLSTGSLVFNLFVEEILEELRENPDPPNYFRVYGIQRSNPDTWSRGWWRGQKVQVRIVMRDLVNSKGERYQRLAVDLRHTTHATITEFLPFGLVDEKDRSKVAIGETRMMLAYSTKNIRGITHQAVLFDENIDPEAIENYMTHYQQTNFGDSLFSDEELGIPEQ